MISESLGNDKFVIKNECFTQLRLKDKLERHWFHGKNEFRYKVFGKSGNLQFVTCICLNQKLNRIGQNISDACPFCIRKRLINRAVTSEVFPSNS